MNLSAKTEYACIAVLELAVQHGSGRPVRIREIARANGIPARFLVQILLQLKGAGIVTSTRGSAGGYHLARDPADLSLGEVMAIIEGQARGPATSMSNKTVASRTLARVWREVAASERQLLEATSFADLAAQVRGHADQMYYI